MPDFYMIITQKYFPIFRGGTYPLPVPVPYACDSNCLHLSRNFSIRFTIHWVT